MQISDNHVRALAEGRADEDGGSVSAAEPKTVTVEEAVEQIIASRALGVSAGGILACLPTKYHARAERHIARLRDEDRVDWYKSNDDPPVDVYWAVRAAAKSEAP